MAFGLRYFAELRSKFKEVFWRVEIAERDYIGRSEAMKFNGNKPLSITWENRGDEFYVPIKASEATIDILCTENFHYIGLFTADPRRFRVSIYRNTKLYWRGYVVSDLYSENFSKPPYQVSIKAVDGFKLLQNIPYKNLDGSQFTGRKSLLQMISDCVSLLELDLTIANWMDLYAEGMSEVSQPLSQVYVDMERFYGVHGDPSYRDVLELCLRPFAGQIFQSNGALNIRRVISLYNSTRPVSFFSTGTEYPSGWLTAANGQTIVTNTGEPIITSKTRDRIESMWEDEINISGEATMDIVPALRAVSIGIKNKGMDNLVPHLGFYKLSSWYDPYEFLSLTNATTLRFIGDKDRQGYVIETYGYPIQQCAYTLILEYAVRGQYAKYGSSYRSSGDNEHKINFYYGLKLVGATKTYWLQDDGQWVAYEGFMMEEVKTSTETNKKIEIQGIPESGTLKFYIKQTLKYNVSESNRFRYGEWEAVSFYDMSIRMDTGDDYENSLTYTTLVNHANNVEMSIQLPMADIPNIPNASSVYSLYFVDSRNRPTRMWHTKGKNDYNTLINHLVQCALRFKQRPSRRISGEMFTGKHIDMNTVVQDDKYLHAGFYVNSLELDALEDTFNTELVEMPGLLNAETPPPGDDCILISSLGFTVKKVVKCEHLIVLLTTTNKIYGYDTAARSLTLLASYNQTVNISPADGGFCIVEGTAKGSAVVLMDFRGVVMKKHISISSELALYASYMGGYFYVINAVSTYDRDTGEYVFDGYSMTRPDYPYTSASNSYRGGGYRSARLGNVIKGIQKSFSALVVNTDIKAYLHDRRVSEEMKMQELPTGTEVLSISDYYMTENDSAHFKIYRRDTYSERTLVATISPKADFSDHTLGEVAFSTDKTVKIRTFANATIRYVRNTAGSSKGIKGLCYVNGELYIIRDTAIYKYIPES